MKNAFSHLIALGILHLYISLGCSYQTDFISMSVMEYDEKFEIFLKRYSLGVDRSDNQNREWYSCSSTNFASDAVFKISLSHL